MSGVLPALSDETRCFVSDSRLNWLGWWKVVQLGHGTLTGSLNISARARYCEVKKILFIKFSQIETGLQVQVKQILRNLEYS